MESLIEYQRKCVKECTIFIENLFRVNGVNNRTFKVKLKDGSISLNSHTGELWFKFKRIYEFELRENSIRVEWFCRTKSIGFDMIEEIWLEDIPLYVNGKERFWNKDNSQKGIMFYIPYSKDLDFDRRIELKDKDELNKLIERIKNI